MIFDTHAHYDDEAFDDDREKLLERMQNRGVEYIVNVGASMSSCKSTIGLVRRFPYVYGALGVHPDEVSELTEEDYQWLKKSIYKPKIVAVGEIGLDYHWNDNKEQQIEWFEKQMDIAREAELPIIIHSRDAANDTYEVMKANKADEIGGVIHCFSYTKEMAEKQAIIRKLPAVETLGSTSIICTDKTGTLTQDKVVLEYHLNINGDEDMRVLRHAYLNSYFQTGYKNLMDLAIIEKTEEAETKNRELINLSNHYKKVDEIPFDFNRRRLSTVVEDINGKTQMVTKGAIEEMLSICSYVEFDGKVQNLTDSLCKKIIKTVDDLNEKGFRVLGIAQKSNPSPVGAFGVKDECEMVLLGYLAFLDPPKESTADAIRTLKEYGIATKILTGDNDKVTRTVCKQVGLEVRNMLLGSDINRMSDEELANIAETTDVFAKLTPDQKSRVVTVLRQNGHTVGFMGDGINDAAAMKCADIGISVDTAVDVAKESADIVLLEKDLMVLEEGIIEGRKTYANMIKYIKMTASSNFGNMFSVLAASALLPFLPMMSIHLLCLNLIYDLSCTAIPWDNVDEEFIKVPRKWDASSVGKFMMWMGPVSSIFDFTTYIFMYFVFCPIFVSHGVLYNDLASVYSGAELMQMQFNYIAMFQAGWFVESMWSQTLVIHMIRTPKLPFIESSASLPVSLLTLTGIIVLTVIPFTPLGTILGFVSLPGAYFAYLIPCIIAYMLLATSIKKAYVRHFGELL